MNCTPGAKVWVRRTSRCEPCSALLLGVPAQVSHLQMPQTMFHLLREQLEGPVWMLQEPFRCPRSEAGCPGIDRLPDACLQPFDPESAPGEEEAPEALGMECGVAHA